MAKKKKNNISKDMLMVITVLLFGLSFSAAAMCFFPGVKINFSIFTCEVDGMYAVFGGTQKTSLGFNLDYAFNTFAFIGYLLALVTGILSIFAFRKKGKLMYFLVAGIALISSLLIFLEPVFFKSVNATELSSINDLFQCQLAIGPILGGIFALLAGVISLITAIMKNN